MKHFSALFPVLGATAALSFTLTGCNQPSDQTAQTSPSPSASASAAGSATGAPATVSAASIKTVKADEKIKVAFITNNASDFWTIARRGVEKADAELPNLTTEFRMPQKGTAAEQTAIIGDLIAKGVNGLAISPKDPAGQTGMLNKTAEQVLVVTQDSDAADSKRACYVGTDNFAAGEMAGKEILRALPNGGKIAVFVGSKDAQNAQDRFKGIQKALEGSKVVIMPDSPRTDETKRDKAKSNVADTLVQHEDVACLVGLWSYNGPAILQAVKDAKKVGKVKIVCFDEEDDTLKGVREGAIFATVVQQPYEFGYQSVKLMDKALRGMPNAIPADKKIIVPTRSITKENVVAFEAKVATLRGRTK